MDDLFKPPPKFRLLLSKGGDLYCGFRYKTPVLDGEGNPVLDAEGNPTFEATDYPSGSTVALTIDTSPPIVVDAVIDGSLATIWEQSEVVDPVRAGKFWRTVITYSNGLDRVMCNGKTVRKDGG